MDLTILLGDSAQVSPDNKVHALGLGWTATRTPLPPHAVIILFDIPWNETNHVFVAKVRLVDADGNPVHQLTPMGEQPIEVEAQFEAGRPPGLPPGTSLTMPLAFNLPPGTPVRPGRYEWRVEVDGEERANWRRGFLVVEQQASPRVA
ncbi:DUF6941 family protein [Saccharothrix variisporea]|uniref:Uncharacterized protein n=1 Tax=Saccharothrix variisporea TaxID=543527 RepID=A0A495X9V9_9PSEU|nr:hypothetical protein [Saccharothrix variisporea]RKT70166.1 hypothetical protein DFJ66_3413 [Saccharothrix variisporea]